jgi:hypothetical protein
MRQKQTDGIALRRLASSCSALDGPPATHLPGARLYFGRGNPILIVRVVDGP